jgi:ribosomal protein L16/L10AE
MRAKRGFINYRRKIKGVIQNTLHYSDRAHRFYQAGSSFKIVTRSGSILKQKWKEPVFKLVRKHLKKKSFVMSAFSLFYKSTSKPIGIRMGKGKGKIDMSLAVVKPGQPIVSVAEASELSVSKLYKLLKGRTSSKSGVRLVTNYF